MAGNYCREYELEDKPRGIIWDVRVWFYVECDGPLSVPHVVVNAIEPLAGFVGVAFVSRAFAKAARKDQLTWRRFSLPHEDGFRTRFFEDYNETIQQMIVDGIADLTEEDRDHGGT